MHEEKREAMGGKQKKKINWDLLPVILMFAVLPLITRMRLMENPLKDYPWFPGDEERGDFFVYWKGCIDLLLVVWMLVVLADRRLIRGKAGHSYRRWIPLLGYCILATLSTVLSVDRGLSLHGMLEQFETLWVLLGYAVTVYYCSSVIEDWRDVKIVLAALAAGGACQCLIGISQIAGHSFWETGIGKFLMIPEKYDAEDVIFNFAGEKIHRVYMALYHPNYAAVYIVMILPVILAVGTAAKKKVWKYVSGVLAVLLVWCLIETGSKTGLAVLGLEMALFLIFAWPSGKKQRISLGAALLAIVAGIAGYDFATGHRAAENLAEAFQREDRAYLLEGIKAEQDDIFIRFAGKELYVCLDNRKDSAPGISVRDRRGQEMEMEALTDSRYRITGDAFKTLFFHVETQGGIPYIVIEYQDLPWYFTDFTEDGGYSYITRYGKTDVICEADHAFPEDWDVFLTYRGYIWGRTIPLLKKYLLWGSGPDTFTVVFPQNDYLTRAKLNNGFFTEILTKPHNMYLQTALQTGILSLMCLLILWGSYFADFLNICGKIRKEQRGRKDFRLCTAVFVGIIAYLAAGMTNDSTLVTAPVFWGMLGIGIAVNDFYSHG